MAAAATTAVLPDNQLRELLVSKFILLNYPFTALGGTSWWKSYLQPASIDIPIGTFPHARIFYLKT